MTATLYWPQQPPQSVPVYGLSFPESAAGFAGVLEQVPSLLDCAPGLVDVLFSNPRCIIYAVFDSEGEINGTAMDVAAAASGVPFDRDDEDAILRGPILVVSR
ncbi:hypothetical protein [Hymenobacter sp. PAMC 26628]|uniref:hypothetical protein n=1 Tax=Hymenobacter sp. PAMC 26628 TaxID=1484118 RepID=UPI0007702590|nr:hypothetical protein [Hymenobacter sp. PAMC 26628]AMJ65956.1 hypothetical protein AXW84_11325 [Hymenobacter sp. PAMC 26628]